MRNRLPSLSALLCFEKVTRVGSVTVAARELNLTQSAVSRRIAALEESLGCKLFERSNKKLLPTKAAEQYAAEIADIITRIEASTTRLLTNGQRAGSLTVSVLPTLGTRWLVPRLGEFLSVHPYIELDLVSRVHAINFESHVAQVAIRFGASDWRNTKSEFLMNEEMVAVAAPALLEQEGERFCASELSQRPLIQHSTRPLLWQKWFDLVGVSAPQATSGQKFEYYNLVVQAALAGLGYAILPELLIRRELDSGVLRLAHPQSMLSCKSYYAVYPEHCAENPNVKAFVAWLKESCAQSISGEFCYDKSSILIDRLQTQDSIPGPGHRAQ